MADQTGNNFGSKQGTDCIVTNLRDWAAIIDESKCDAAVVMLSGLIFTNAADEIERLQRWKVEACSVLADWDALYVSLGDRGELGQRKSALVAAEIERLRAALAIAAGMISTFPPYQHEHPQTVMEMLLEEARRGYD